MLETILPLLVPAISSWLTQLLKRLNIRALFEGNRLRKPMLRLAVVVFSFLSLLASHALSGAPIDPVSVQALVETVLASGVAFLLYAFGSSSR